MIKLKVRTTKGEFLIPVKKDSSIKDINKEIQDLVDYKGDLYFKDSKLIEKLKISKYFQENEVYDYIKKETILLNLIPNGHWITYYHQKKRVEESPNETLETLESLIKKEYNIDNSFWLQMFNDRLPLFITDNTKEYTLKQLNFKSNDNFYIDILPHAMTQENRYDFVSEDDRFKENLFWTFPKQQSKFSLSTFFSTLTVMKGFFKDYNNYGCDSLFFHLLYDFFPFPPAVSAFYRLFRSQAMKIDLAIIARSFYFWMVDIFRSQPNYNCKDAFNNFPLFIFCVLKEINFTTDVDQANVFIESSLKNNSNKKFAEPVYYDNSIGEKEEFKSRNILETHLTDAYDVRALLETFKNENEIKNYLFSIRKQNVTSDVKEYREFMTLRNELSKHSWCRFLAYTPREILGAQNCRNCLSAIYDEESKEYKTIVIVERLKILKKDDVTCPKEYKVVENHSSKTYIDLKSIIDKSQMNKFGLAVLEEAIDTRPIEQIDVILLDQSGSMADSIPMTNQNKAAIQKFNASVMCTTTIIDKLYQYDLSHAVGFIAFNDSLNKKNITRDYEHICKELDLINPEGLTDLWPTVIEAVEMIKRYKNDSKNKFILSKYLKCRIICITDGEDTSQKSYKEVSQILVDENIIFDSIFVDALEHGRACKILNLISKFTGGLCIQSTKNCSDLLQNLTREAFLSLSQRKEIKPEERPFEIVEKEALTNRLEANKCELKHIPMDNKAVKNPIINQGNIEKKLKTMSRFKRILYEFKEALNHQSIKNNFEFYIDEQQADYWRVIFTPSVGTLYFSSSPKLYWFMTVRFPETYPQAAPEVRFITPLYHPNVNVDGRICHEIFSTKYHVLVSVTNIFAQILDMIADPNENEFSLLLKRAH